MQTGELWRWSFVHIPAPSSVDRVWRHVWILSVAGERGSVAFLFGLPWHSYFSTSSKSVLSQLRLETQLGFPSIWRN